MERSATHLHNQSSFIRRRKMAKNSGAVSKMLVVLRVMVFSYAFVHPAYAAEPIIIDHTCTDMSQIPADWLEKAKQLTLHYAHTSHVRGDVHK